MIAIPISIMLTFCLLKVMGRTLNVISLAGIAFAVGMVLDAAIVVLESIYRRTERGYQQGGGGAGGDQPGVDGAGGLDPDHGRHLPAGAFAQ